MREIKFRAWVKKDKVMRTVTLLNTAYMGTEYQTIYFNYLGGSFRHLPEVELMQFTGLLDKNGKEIFEGDIISFDGYMTADNSFGIEPNGFIYDDSSIHVVLWDSEMAAWNLNFSDDDEKKYKRDTRGLFQDGDCEVIGNIYDSLEDK